jgi:hypothetical protein
MLIVVGRAGHQGKQNLDRLACLSILLINQQVREGDGGWIGVDCRLFDIRHITVESNWYPLVTRDVSE